MSTSCSTLTEAATQSAALPYRRRDGRVEVLLVTPRGGRGWIIPKGKIEAALGPCESARREAHEEGGVEGDIHPEPFDQYRHGGRPLVSVYLMDVTREMESWPEAHVRERRWAPLGEVPGLVADPGLLRVMRAAHLRLVGHAWEGRADGMRGHTQRRLQTGGFGPMQSALAAAAAAAGLIAIVVLG
jgi:8-oxo-dGTP pyrophosphatase MutT (NUDIX family)